MTRTLAVLIVALTAPLGVAALAGARDVAPSVQPARSEGTADRCTAESVAGAGELETRDDSRYGTLYRLAGTRHWMR
jgi:hypothetical protein